MSGLKLRTTEAPKQIIKYSGELFPTGVTLLNCACSGTHQGGFAPGKVVNIIGDSFTGKTLLALTVLAEISQLPQFDHYRFIFDDVEAALEFDIKTLFGPKVAKRIEMNIISKTIEDWGTNLAKALIRKTPFIYILDSFDAVTSKAEQERAKAKVKPPKRGEKKEKTKGTYGIEKPKIAGEIFRAYIDIIKAQEALVIVISQTRQNIGNTFVPKTRSGGDALRFFSTHEMWLAHWGMIWKGKIMEIGADVGVKVTKNKLTGHRRRISFPIYDDYGIGDVHANVDYVIEEGIWKKAEGKERIYQATEIMDIVGQKATLVNHIIRNDLQEPLQELVGHAWQEMEERESHKWGKKYA